MSTGTPTTSIWHSGLILLAIATALAALAAAVNPRARSLLAHGGRAPDEITLAEARAPRGPQLWLDARPSRDYGRNHIPEALPLNEDQWDEQIQTVLLRWQPGTQIIVYCSATGCGTSREVAAKLRRDYHLDNVWVLHGGWDAWEKALAR